MNARQRSAPSTDPLAELGEVVLGEQPLPQLLEQVVHLAIEVLPVSAVSITLISNGEARTAAFTAEAARALDTGQYQDDGGPGLHAARTGQTVLISDTGVEIRWPSYNGAAVASGVFSSLSVPLPGQRQVAGSLNFYAATRDGFDGIAVEVARTLAGHAAVAVANAYLYEATARLVEQMQQAMVTRAVIEQAKTIIMRDRGCSAADATTILVERSGEVTDDLDVAMRRLPDPLPGQPAELPGGVARRDGLWQGPMHFVAGDGTSLCGEVAAADIVRVSPTAFGDMAPSGRCNRCDVILPR